MTASPQKSAVDPETPTGAHSTPYPAPYAAETSHVQATSARTRRTFSARVTAAIGAGALVVGAALGTLTGGFVGPGGPGGGPGGQPPGTSQGTGTQGTAPGDTATGGTATQGATGT